MAGKTEVLGENLPQYCFVTKYPIWPDLGWKPGRRCGKPVTNRLSYGKAFLNISTQSTSHQVIRTIETGKVKAKLSVWLINEAPRHDGVREVEVPFSTSVLDESEGLSSGLASFTPGKSAPGPIDRRLVRP
jgi:hypothetical protein